MARDKKIGDDALAFSSLLAVALVQAPGGFGGRLSRRLVIQAKLLDNGRDLPLLHEQRGEFGENNVTDNKSTRRIGSLQGLK